MKTLHIRQAAADKKKHWIRLTVKWPGQADNEAKATNTFTYYRRTLLQ